MLTIQGCHRTIKLSEEEVKQFSQNWEYFDIVLSVRWVSETSITLPFSCREILDFITLARRLRDYSKGITSPERWGMNNRLSCDHPIIQYFVPKDLTWVLGTRLTSCAPASYYQVFARVLSWREIEISDEHLALPQSIVVPTRLPSRCWETAIMRRQQDSPESWVTLTTKHTSVSLRQTGRS